MMPYYLTAIQKTALGKLFHAFLKAIQCVRVSWVYSDVDFQ